MEEMTRNTYIFNTKKTLQIMWLFCPLILCLIWVVCLFRFYHDKSNYPDSHAWLGFLSPVFLSVVLLVAWLSIRKVSYDISSVKVIKKRGDKIVHSIDFCDVQSFIANVIITLKVSGSKDFLFRGIGTKAYREQLLTALRQLGIREDERKKVKPAQVIIICMAILFVIHFLGSVTMWIIYTCCCLKYYRVGIDWPMYLHAIPAIAFLLMSTVVVWLAYKRKRGAFLLLGLTILASVLCFIYEKKKEYYQLEKDDYCTWWWYSAFDKPEKSELSDYSSKYYKYGYIDSTGQIVIEPNYDFADDFSEGLASVGYRIKIEDADEKVVERQNGRANQDYGRAPFRYSRGETQYVILFGFIDTAGKIVIEPQFDSTNAFSDGMSLIGIGGKYGYINRSGEVVIKPQFDYRARDFSEGFAVVFVNEQFIFIDKKGEVAFPERFDNADKFTEGLAPVKIGGKWGYIDRTGQIVIKPQFDYARDFNEKMTAVKINGKWGFIDNAGNVIIEPKFDDAFSFHEDIGTVRIDGKWGLDEKWGCIDNSGRIVIEPRSWYPPKFCGELARVCYATGWGYREKYRWEWIDKTGMAVKKPYFDKAYSFSEGLAKVKINDKCGFINQSGIIVIEPQFDTVSRFSEGLAIFGIEAIKKEEY